MSETKKKVVRILVLMTAALLFAGFVYGQDFDNANRNPLSRILPGTGYGGMLGPVAGSDRDSQRMDNLTGVIIGSFFWYMIENNRYEDQNHYYSDRNSDRARDRDRDRDRDRNRFRDRDRARYDRYDRYNQGHDDRPHPGYWPHGR